MKTKIFAIHGFLGESEDWVEVRRRILEEKPEWEFYAVDLFDGGRFSPKQTFEKWAKEFNDFVRDQGEGRRTMLGYSLGGRLGLYALEAQPDLWTAAVFLSTHPGLRSNAEKGERVISDQKWADRFLNDNFAKVLQDWNSQGVLKAEFQPDRSQKINKRDQYAQALTQWSLGVQKDFRLLMDMWPAKQIWAAGEKDEKFSQILRTLPESSEIQRWVVEGVSHRLFFEAPEEVAHFAIRISSRIRPG